MDCKLIILCRNIETVLILYSRLRGMTSFTDFAETCQRIENIPGSLEMTQVVADLFSSVDCMESIAAWYRTRPAVYFPVQGIRCACKGYH